MKKILGFMFILSFLISCQSNTLRATSSVQNAGKNSKANATFNVKIKSGICNNCD